MLGSRFQGVAVLCLDAPALRGFSWMGAAAGDGALFVWVVGATVLCSGGVVLDSEEA